MANYSLFLVLKVYFATLYVSTARLVSISVWHQPDGKPTFIYHYLLCPQTYYHHRPLCDPYIDGKDHNH